MPYAPTRPTEQFHAWRFAVVCPRRAWPIG
jgi:hypothetical protein